MKNYFFRISKILLYVVPFCLVIVSSSTLFPFIVGKYTFFRIAVGLSFIFFLLGLGFGSYSGYSNGKKLLEKLKSPLVIAVSVFVFIFLLAGFLGINPSFSFWSNFERGEGGVQLFFFYIFFLLLTLLFTEKKDWRLLLKIFLAVAVLVILYGIAAGLKYVGMQIDEGGSIIGPKDASGKLIESSWLTTFNSYMGGPLSFSLNRFAGSLGNPAYLAPFLLFIFFYAFYLLFTSDSRKTKYFILPLVVFYLFFFWWSQTRGAFLGLIAGLFFFVVYLILSLKGKWRTWSVGALVCLALIGGLLFYFNDSNFVKKIPGSRLFGISLKEDTAQTRLWTWGSAIKGIKEKPILGWGPENFPAVFDKYFDIRHFNPSVPRSETWFDRAHSVYFDYLAETGILGFLSYLSVFAVFYMGFFKAKKQPGFPDNNHSANDSSRKSSFLNAKFNSIAVSALIFSLPLAYLVQGIFIFDVTPIYINLFLFLALANFIFREQKLQNEKDIKKIELDPLIKKTLAILGSAIIIVFVYYGAYLPFKKSQLLIGTMGNIQNGVTVEGFEKTFSSVLDFYSPVGQDESVKQLGSATLGILSGQQNLPREIAEELLKFNLKYFDPIVESGRGGNFSQNFVTLSQLYLIIGERFNDQNYLNKAIEYYKEGLVYSPRRPQFLYGLMQAYQDKGDFQAAKKIGEEILTYWPNDIKVKQNIEAMKNIK